MPIIEILILAYLGFATFIIAALVASMMADRMLTPRFRFATAMLGGMVGYLAAIWLVFEQTELYLAWFHHFAKFLGPLSGGILLHMLLGAFSGLVTAIFCKVAESLRFRLRGTD